MDKEKYSEIKFKLNFLMDILDQKLKFLNQIYNITENQEFFEKTLSGEDQTILLKEAINEKQKIIDDVITADNTFMKIFGEFKGDLNRNQDTFKAEIKKMQEKIREVSSVDFKIRAKEQRAKQGIQITPPVLSKKIKTLKSSKNYILDKYKKNTQKPL